MLAAFLITATALIYLYPAGRSFFIINGMHSSSLDLLFSNMTHVGDGLAVAVIAILLLLFYNVGSGLMSLLGLGICGLFSYLMKYHIFAKSPRPKHFFWEIKHQIHFVNDVTINTENSFPSGHTLTAFFIFTYLAMMSFSKPILFQFGLALLAMVAAYSRVYLAQHFMGDVVIGGIIGMILGLVFYKLYTRSKNWPAMRKKILHIFKK